MTTRAVCFDFNGTISHDEPILCEIFVELFAEHGKPLSAQEYFDRLAGLSDPEIVRTWLGPDHPDVDEVIDERVARYVAAVADGSTVPESVRAAVRHAAARVPVAVVTGAARAEVEPVLEAAGLTGSIGAIVTADDVVDGKPHPEGYLRALDELGVGPVGPGEAVAFEDTEAGVASAKAAGFRCLAVLGTLDPHRLAAADEIVPAIDVPLVERVLSSVKIAAVDVFGYELRYRHGSYVMSGGRSIDALPSTVVRIRTDEGIEGFGETCPLGPAYLPAFGEGARAALHELAPALVGLDPRNLALVNETMDSALRGHEYAKSAVDVACWDVLGKATSQPVATLLGGLRQDSYPLYVAIPLGPAETMVEHVRERIAEGIHRFQLKLGADPREDARRVAAVVEATSDDEIVVADANGGYRLQDAVVAARLLEDMPRTFYEQPCASLEECLYVRRLTTLPMILDESITDVHSLLRAWSECGMEGINLKVSKVGGLTRAKLVRDLAEELGLRLTIEDTWGGDLVTAAVSHLAGSTSPGALFTVSFMNDWTLEHVAGYQPRSEQGIGRTPAGPGLGVDVDLELLGEPLFSAS